MKVIEVIVKKKKKESVIYLYLKKIAKLFIIIFGIIFFIRCNFDLFGDDSVYLTENDLFGEKFYLIEASDFGKKKKFFW